MGGSRRSFKQLSKNPSYLVTENAGISLDAEQGLFDCGTVMLRATQASLYCGAQEIAMVGFDLTNTQQPRFYERENQVAFSRIDRAYHLIENHVSLFATACQARGVGLFNLSPNSRLPRSIVPYANWLDAPSPIEVS